MESLLLSKRFLSFAVLKEKKHARRHCHVHAIVLHLPAVGRDSDKLCFSEAQRDVRTRDKQLTATLWLFLARFPLVVLLFLVRAFRGVMSHHVPAANFLCTCCLEFHSRQQNKIVGFRASSKF